MRKNSPTKWCYSCSISLYLPNVLTNIDITRYFSQFHFAKLHRCISHKNCPIFPYFHLLFPRKIVTIFHQFIDQIMSWNMSNDHSMRGTYLFQPKTIKYTSCNANDYYSNLINSELSTRWTGYSCGLNKCSFSYHTRIQSCKVELFYYSYSLSKLMPFVDDIYNWWTT